MTEDTTMLRVKTDLLKKARELFPEMKGLSETALTDFLIRKALKKEAS